MTDGIEVDRRGRVQILRFARPDKKNAITGPMYGALAEALEIGDASPEIGAHVILGSGGVFTAGNDLADFLGAASGPANFDDGVLRFIRLLPRIAKPVVAGVDGLAVGVGTTLLFHCDLVYASPAALFSTPFLDLGLVPEAGSSLLAPKLLGFKRAFELLILGNIFSAERALQSGLVNEIFPSASLDDTAIDAARRLAEKPAEALAMSRNLLRGDTAAISQRIEDEAQLFAERLQSTETAKALQAFFDMRLPKTSPQ